MESTRKNNSINAINDVRTLLNELRNNLSREESKRIRKKLRRIEAVYNVLKEKEQKGSLTSRQKNMLRNDERYLKNICKHLKNLKKHLKKYQYGSDYLFNEHNEEGYTSNNDINAINDVRTLLNELRNNLSREEINRIRKKLYKKEAVYNFLKNIGRYLKNIAKHLKNLKKHFRKLQKHQYGLDYLFNEHNEEDDTSNNNINVFKEARKLLNEARSNFLRKETKRIRKKLRGVEAVYNVLKEKEQKDSLTSRQKNMLRNDERYLKNLKKDLEKLQKYSITYGLDYLFDELNEVDYYEPERF